MQDKFVIQHHLTFIEFYKSSLYLGIRNKRLRKFYYLVPGLLLLTGLLSFLLDPKKSSNSITSILQILFPLLFLIVFFYGGVFILCLFFLLIKPGYFRNVIYEFTNWGMIKTGEKFEYSSPWNKFLKMRETKSCFFLYINENDAHIIQKRMFLNMNEADSFKNFIDKQLGLFQ